jgi:ETC complex I subunit conserved region
MKQVIIQENKKSTAQSGKAKIGGYSMKYVRTTRQENYAMTGWVSESECEQQITLDFTSLEEAQKYAVSKGLEVVDVITTTPSKIKLQSYAANFS